ncbi:MAG: SpoIIE family protein phosphatase [Bacteroidales bacterium]|nr:SpoIIE family protein phosphatase [Bacteroidales bacterium]
MDSLSSINEVGEFSLIEKHKKELNDSIHYASYIQKALLPSQKEIDRYFPQNFILYLPKDVVSGDFYWFYRLKNKIVFAVADCTGHGVPGAFMSVLGISILNQIVLSHKNISAGGVLDLLREHVMKSLHQTGSSGEQKDGMDIALGILDLSTNQLQFAGAYNPLYLVRKGHLINFPGDRMPIGIDPLEEKPFKNHDIPLKSNDMLYMFSDGFADQFGGKKGKKFKYKPFRELLVAASELPLKDQKEMINQSFHEWKWSHGQVDDILIIGIRYIAQ